MVREMLFPNFGLDHGVPGTSCKRGRNHVSYPFLLSVASKAWEMCTGFSDQFLIFGSDAMVVQAKPAFNGDEKHAKIPRLSQTHGALSHVQTRFWLNH